MVALRQLVLVLLLLVLVVLVVVVLVVPSFKPLPSRSHSYPFRLNSPLYSNKLLPLLLHW
jgi:hypothetical protein